MVGILSAIWPITSPPLTGFALAFGEDQNAILLFDIHIQNHCLQTGIPVLPIVDK